MNGVVRAKGNGIIRINVLGVNWFIPSAPGRDHVISAPCTYERKENSEAPTRCHTYALEQRRHIYKVTILLSRGMSTSKYWLELAISRAWVWSHRAIKQGIQRTTPQRIKEYKRRRYMGKANI